jgi:hypothetical protein
VTVLIRAGTYRLGSPLIFTPADSGDKGCPVTYAAYSGEAPVLSGGVRLGGFKAEGVLWKTQLPRVLDGGWRPMQLFVNGHRCPRARTPNRGYLRMTGPAPPVLGPDGKEVDRSRSAFSFRPGDLKPWDHLEDVNVVLMHSWETSIHPIKTVDTTANVVEFVAPWKESWKIGYWEKEQRYYVENALELLDSPGEWYLDRTTGVLSYYPLPGERIDTAETIAPRLTSLVEWRGDPAAGQWVEYVGLRGLALAHEDWVLKPEGNSSAQAAFEVPAAITADGARECFLEDCDIAHVGTYAVWVRRGCRDFRVVRNQIHDLGAGALRIGEAPMAANDMDVTSHTLVDNNYIHHYGEVYAGAVGIWLAHASDNTISHNEICDGYYSAISLGWNWNDAPTRALRNLVEFNHLHHVGQGVMSDMGGIYTLGRQTGTVLRNNLIHDVFAYDTPPYAWGIYHDGGSNGITSENNVCYNTTCGGFANTGMYGNVIRNNIFACGAQQLIWRWKVEGAPPTPFERNICYVTQGILFNDDAGREDTASPWDYNLFWRADGKPLEFYDGTFEQWQAKGMDRHSLVADPQFVDPGHGNFALKPTSPAITQLGFKPIDTSQCGLYGDPAWVALPRAARFPPSVLPPIPPPPPPQAVADDFEATVEGGAPADATVYGDDAVAGSSVRVSREVAHSGTHSLKLVDSPLLTEAFNPHFYYQPHFREGVARFSFALYLKPGAIAAVEWRDGRTQFRVGPSMLIDAAGHLSVNGKALMDVPRDRWIEVQQICGLGTAATGKWTLTVTVAGDAPQQFQDLPCGTAKFDALEWLGFISLATDKAEWYVDDVKLETTQGAGG